MAVAQSKRAAPIVVIDGRSGSGKSTLASAVVDAWHAPVCVLPLDAVYPGWDGLRAGADRVIRDVVARHARGEPGEWVGWDWDARRPAARHLTDSGVPLVVEGVGALTSWSARLADVSVWLDAPGDLRRERALDRDGDTYAPHWERWARQEERHIVENTPSALASLRFTLG